MAHHFNPDMQNMGIDPNMDILMNPFQDFNPAGPGLMGFSQDNYSGYDHHHHFPGILAADNFPLVFPEEFKSLLSITTEPNCSSANDRRHLEVPQDHSCDDEKKRKSMHTPECSSANSSPPVSENGIARRNSTARGKKLRSNEKEDEKSSKEVVHVRAKRGQATDSHSLAERVRRGKINERLRCLQDIVPGCQRTMGMAVMLDEIINYVQSLQNQVEFLSMKLTAASNLYSYSGEADTIDAIQRAKALEAMKMHRRMKEEWEEIAASTQVGPFDLTFGCYPSSPFNT